MYMYVCTAEVLSLAKLYTSFQRVQLKAKIICHRLKIFLVKSHLNSYIIEFPQNSRERSDSRNALIRGRSCILCLNALSRGISKDLYSSGNWDSVALST